MWHNPLACAVGTAVYLFDEEFFLLNTWSHIIACFVLHRAFLLLHKANYMFLSLVTAYKNKKQRFAMQTIIFALEFTIFLPITIGVLLISTLLNTATIPFLGFAFFTVGSLKPVRNWSQIAA